MIWLRIYHPCSTSPEPYHLHWGMWWHMKWSLKSWSLMVSPIQTIFFSMRCDISIFLRPKNLYPLSEPPYLNHNIGEMALKLPSWIHLFNQNLIESPFLTPFTNLAIIPSKLFILLSSEIPFQICDLYFEKLDADAFRPSKSSINLRILFHKGFFSSEISTTILQVKPYSSSPVCFPYLSLPLFLVFPQSPFLYWLNFNYFYILPKKLLCGLLVLHATAFAVLNKLI